MQLRAAPTAPQGVEVKRWDRGVAKGGEVAGWWGARGGGMARRSGVARLRQGRVDADEEGRGGIVEERARVGDGEQCRREVRDVETRELQRRHQRAQRLARGQQHRRVGGVQQHLLVGQDRAQQVDDLADAPAHTSADESAFVAADDHQRPNSTPDPTSHCPSHKSPKCTAHGSSDDGPNTVSDPFTFIEFAAYRPTNSRPVRCPDKSSANDTSHVLLSRGDLP